MATETWNIDAGTLRQQVTLETGVIQAADSRGTVKVEWPTVPVAGGTAQGDDTEVGTSTPMRAEVDTLSGRKLELARQLVATATHKVTIRYRQSLDIANSPEALTVLRFVFKGRYLNVGHIANIENRNVRLECTCTEQRTP